jgi:polysaccharide export outer membrane protein
MIAPLLVSPLLASLAVTGCTAPGAGLSPISASTAGPYHLGVGDQVRIITFGTQQLSGEFRVNDSGNISLPLVGAVPAAGLTPGQLESSIVNTLKTKGLFGNPSVSVEVITYRPFFILGEVSKPGQYPYQPGMTVLTAVAVGGGFTYRAVTDRFSIVRHSDDKAAEYLADRQTFVEPGDVITVYERRF